MPITRPAATTCTCRPSRLTDELFWRALDAFEYYEVKGIIVDLRQNGGGSTQGFAGYLTDRW